jgi:hypothetical protein
MIANPYSYLGGPKGTRTPVFGVRGRRPRPLDDGTLIHFVFMNVTLVYQMRWASQGKETLNH